MAVWPLEPPPTEDQTARSKPHWTERLPVGTLRPAYLLTPSRPAVVCCATTISSRRWCPSHPISLHVAFFPLARPGAAAVADRQRAGHHRSAAGGGARCA